jgi:hypothetical protein
MPTALSLYLFFFIIINMSIRTSTNSTGPEINDHVSLQWLWDLWNSN